MINFSLLDILDILLVSVLLYYIYKLVRGTSAINIFLGIIIIYLVWKFTEFIGMEMFSSVLGEFIGVGMFALIVVFKEEIRQFLLMIGSTNLTNKEHILRQLNFLKQSSTQIKILDINALVEACDTLKKSYTGALIVIKRTLDLDFVKETGDSMFISINAPIIESIFYKNSTLHDGAIVIEGNHITATRAVLPVTNDRSIPLQYGLRHRAAIGITEKTDAIAIVVSEETGKISYIKEGKIYSIDKLEELSKQLQNDV